MNSPVNKYFYSRQGRIQNFKANISPVKTDQLLSKRPIITHEAANKVLNQIENEKKQEAKTEPKKQTSSFKVVSRDQYWEIFKERKEAPDIGTYSPVYTATSPNPKLIPKMKTRSSSPKETKVLLPRCVDQSLLCTFPKPPKTAIENFDLKTRRTVSDSSKYEHWLKNKKEKWNPIPEKISHKLESPVIFEKENPRKAFVGNEDPPHPLRFNFVFPESEKISSNKKVSGFSVEKTSKRGELFRLGLSVVYFDKNEEVTMPELTELNTRFESMTGREKSFGKEREKHEVGKRIKTDFTREKLNTKTSSVGSAFLKSSLR